MGKRRGATIERCWCRRFAVGCLVFVAWMMPGCGAAVRNQVDQLRKDFPGLTGLLAWSGAAEEPQPITRCGPNGILSLIVPDCPLDNFCFSAACYGHDVCYSTCGTSEQTCDGVFFWDMVYLCDSANMDEGTRTRCYGLAWIYYEAVRTYGYSYFDQTQSIVCDLSPDFTDDATESEAMSGMMPSPPFMDEDGDLMPDEWEAENMLDPTDAGDALLDYDNDGLVNLAEYVRGTDPWRRDELALQR